MTQQTREHKIINISSFKISKRTINLQKLYLTKVLPHLRNFKMCEIYSFEIRKIEQELAESLNKKIYTKH